MSLNTLGPALRKDSQHANLNGIKETFGFGMLLEGARLHRSSCCKDSLQATSVQRCGLKTVGSVGLPASARATRVCALEKGLSPGF